MIKDQIKDLIKQALKELGFASNDLPDFAVEHPDMLSHGDYATNVALILAKKNKQNPVEFSKQLVEKLNQIKQAQILKIETAGPGFINFYLAPEFFAAQTKEILRKGKKFGQSQEFRKQKFFIEHTQPNPFKEFHIGHLMNNSIGESVTRIIKINGAKVKTATYHGDVGLHVAKTIWALLKGEFTLANIGQAYAHGNKAYEENAGIKQEIIEINKKIYEGSDAEINKIYKEGRKISLENFEKIYQRMDSDFNYHFYESEAGVVGKKLVLDFVAKGIFEQSENAIIFKGEKFGEHTRVFINSEGLPTYEAKEVGLAKMKRKKYKYDQSLTVTANEQDSFFDVVEVAIGEVFPKLKGKLRHLSHGVLKLPTGKMSSRTGSIISADSLLTQVRAQVFEKMIDREMTEKEKEETAEVVAIGAIKYSILKQVVGSDIIFDFDKSISFEGDSGPYLQYSCVRAKAVLEKAKKEGIRAVPEKTTGEISNLEKIIYRFEEVVVRAGKEYAPHYLALYLIELAGEFNSFYAQNKIVDSTDAGAPYKVALTKSFVTVMENGLDLLGIKVPEKM